MDQIDEFAASLLVVRQAASKYICHPRMILSGIHGFQFWIPDYTFGNDKFFYAAE